MSRFADPGYNKELKYCCTHKTVISPYPVLVTAMLCVVDRLISRHSIESSSGMFLFYDVSTPNDL